MAQPPMDALSSFNHLTDNIPDWLTQLEALSKHTAAKNAEFVAEYSRLVKSGKPKRVKSPSISSIHSDDQQSIQLALAEASDAANPESGKADEVVEVNPLEAGNRHIYAHQLQRKRKPTPSMKSGASGTTQFRSKHHVVVQYDAHVQEEFNTMVKAVNLARNNLRKGRNALNASRGFRLPTLSKRFDATSFTSSSLDNLRPVSKYRTGPGMSGLSKFGNRTSNAQPQDEDEAAFMTADRALEQIQAFYETAAHQFLRDGDCQKEVDAAKTKLTELLETAKSTAETLKVKAAQQAAAAAAEAAAEADDSVSDLDCPSLLSDKSSMDPLVLPPVPTKSELPTLAQTLKDMKERGIVSAPSLPQAGMTIEVDDTSDGGEYEDIDISHFRASSRLRTRAC